MDKEIYFNSRNTILDVLHDNGKSNRYFKNDMELESEGDKVFNWSHFKEVIKNEITKFIYPFESIVVLAGAGASIVPGENGVPDTKFGFTVSLLAENINSILKEDDTIYPVEELCRICKYAIPIEIDGKYNSTFNLEDFLSKVITYEEYLEEETKKKYSKSKEKILSIIKEKTSYSYDRDKHNHGSLIKILSSLHKAPNRLSIVTTNYDTLFEEAANHLGFTVFDGFSFDSNCIFDIDLFDWSLVKPIYNVKSEKLEYKKSSVNLLKIHGSLSWIKQDDNIARVGKASSSDPIMIFPSSNKYSHSYEKPYFELFSKFQELIKRPNTLLITTGFSFSDNHISKMITQAIKSSPSLSLLCTSHTLEQKCSNKNWDELLELKNDGYRICFLRASLSGDLLDYFGGNSYDN